jgi:hypothetical protein
VKVVVVDPGIPIPPFVQSLTGITDAMVRAAPTFVGRARSRDASTAACSSPTTRVSTSGS